VPVRLYPTGVALTQVQPYAYSWQYKPGAYATIGAAEGFGVCDLASTSSLPHGGVVLGGPLRCSTKPAPPVDYARIARSRDWASVPMGKTPLRVVAPTGLVPVLTRSSVPAGLERVVLAPTGCIGSTPASEAGGNPNPACHGVEIEPSKHYKPTDEINTKHLIVAGHPAAYTNMSALTPDHNGGDGLSVDIGPWTVNIHSDDLHTVWGEDKLVSIARGLTLASSATDQHTWFDLSASLN